MIKAFTLKFAIRNLFRRFHLTLNFFIFLTRLGVSFGEFLKCVEECRCLHEKLNWDLASKSLHISDIGETFFLYAIIRTTKPKIVVETGVANGVSTSFILQALEYNNCGKLYSIDIPLQELLAEGKEIGWIIPNDLRHRWQLLIGKTSEKLLPLLLKLGRIDVFLHDSEHTYENMMFEFSTSWHFIKEGGILMSHDINRNNAFPHFCQIIDAHNVYKSKYFGAIANTFLANMNDY